MAVNKVYIVEIIIYYYLYSFKNNIYIILFTQEQHIKTIRKACIDPATPTTQDALINKITPNIFCTHGKKTPSKVPSFVCLTFLI
jgi:hypothetical protein